MATFITSSILYAYAVAWVAEEYFPLIPISDIVYLAVVVFPLCLVALAEAFGSLLPSSTADRGYDGGAQ